MEEIIAAVDRVKKLELLCETCFSRLGSRWGGAAMTSWNCKKCNGGHVAGSTNHNSVCNGCALTYGLCENCGHNQHMYQKEGTV